MTAGGQTEDPRKTLEDLFARMVERYESSQGRQSRDDGARWVWGQRLDGAGGDPLRLSDGHDASRGRAAGSPGALGRANDAASFPA
jgi:hypothetical protein